MFQSGFIISLLYFTVADVSSVIDDYDDDYDDCDDGYDVVAVVVLTDHILFLIGVDG